MSGKPCPDWCTHHREQYLDSGTFVVEHLTFPFAHQGLHDERPTWWLAVGDFTVSGSDSAADGTIPAGLRIGGDLLRDEDGRDHVLHMSPTEARSLADALVRGAEIVEATETATCATCEAAAAPERLNEDGDCQACQHRKWVASRPDLRLV